MSKCIDCIYWNQYHAKDGYKGCKLWNNYKHLGIKPFKVKGDITCPQCNYEIKLSPEEYDEDIIQKAFEYNLLESGLSNPYEGWVGKGRLINNSIITKADDSCKYLTLKQL